MVITFTMKALYQSNQQVIRLKINLLMIYSNNEENTNIQLF